MGSNRGRDGIANRSITTLVFNSPNMFPVGRREVEMGEQPRHVREERLHGLRILCLVVLGKPLHGSLTTRLALRIHHLV